MSGHSIVNLRLYIHSEELGPMQRKSHLKNNNKSLFVSGLCLTSEVKSWELGRSFYQCHKSEALLKGGASTSISSAEGLSNSVKKEKSKLAMDYVFQHDLYCV